MAGLSMAWQWRARERAIRLALTRRDDPKHFERVAPLLDQCIDKLLAEYGTDTFARPQLSQAPPSEPDRSSYIRTILAIAADRWQVTPPAIDVSLLPAADRARASGTFSLTEQRWLMRLDKSGALVPSADSAWSICIDPVYIDDDLFLTALVAHEFAHGVLHRDGVTMSTPGSDEILTDVATALVGFGGLMLDLQRRVQRGFGGGRQLTWSIGGGYLSTLALEHVLERHQVFR
jgi:hypothetical protein